MLSQLSYQPFIQPDTMDTNRFPAPTHLSSIHKLCNALSLLPPE